MNLKQFKNIILTVCPEELIYQEGNGIYQKRINYLNINYGYLSYSNTHFNIFTKVKLKHKKRFKIFDFPFGSNDLKVGYSPKNYSSLFERKNGSFFIMPEFFEDNEFLTFYPSMYFRTLAANKKLVYYPLKSVGDITIIKNPMKVQLPFSINVGYLFIAYYLAMEFGEELIMFNYTTDPPLLRLELENITMVIAGALNHSSEDDLKELYNG